MKLVFDKDENNDVTVKIQQGTVMVDFSYSEMIKQLLENNQIDKPDFGNLSEDEQESLNSMLGKISDVFKAEEEPNEDQVAENE